MDEKKKYDNMVEIVRSNIKNIELHDLETIREIVRKEIYKRDMRLISKEFDKQFKKLDKVLNEKIKKEIEEKTKIFKNKK